MRLPGNTMRRGGDAGGSMTPMIDVMFQLLIYFLCTASFSVSQQTLPAALPRTGTDGAAAELRELGSIRISLRHAAGRTRIEMNGTPVPHAGELRERVKQVVRLAPLPAVIEAGPDVPLGDVVATYDTCLVAGITDVRFAAAQGL